MVHVARVYIFFYRGAGRISAMILQIWEVKRVACYMLGLNLLLRQLPRLSQW